MVLGIGAFVASIVAYPAMPLGPRWAIPGIILGVSAVILGLVAIARARRERISNKRMAIAGLVTGIVGAVVATFLLVVITRLTSECQDGAVMDEYHAVTLEGCIENKLAD